MRTAQPPDPAVDPGLIAHLTALRLDPRSANADGWRVDWDDGPWPVTVRAGGTRVRLRTASGDPLLDQVSQLLRATFAMGRVRVDPRGGLPATPDRGSPRLHGPRIAARRPVPSGGSMYPAEAYLLLRGPDRWFHHDPYRHELVDLGHPGGAAASPIADVRPAPVVLVISMRFWKNVYKYGEFAFRLGAVDAGVVLGRALRVGTAVFGHASAHPDVDDAALGADLGLDAADEAPYAVLGLGSGAGPDWTRAVWGAGPPEPSAVVERSQRVRRLPRFAAAHAAASRPAPAPREVVAPEPVPPVGPADTLPAPDPVDLLDPELMGRRTSNGRLFRPAPVDARAVATLLTGTAAAVRALHEAMGGALGADVVLLCAAHRVTGVPAGWYRYGAGALVPVGTGPDPDIGRVLQDAMLADSVNVELAALTVHVGAGAEPWLHGRGLRGYREQQLAVGAAVEALTLIATAVGLGSHPVLGFDVPQVERHYGLSGSATGVHAQVSVGPVRIHVDHEIPVMPL